MNKKVFLAICVCLFVFSVTITFETYARYQSSVTGTATLSTAHWSFVANDVTTTFTVDLGSLYPGIDNSYDIRLSAIGSDVDVDYTITFDSAVDIPANLGFYKDSAKQLPINVNGGTVSGRVQAQTDTVITIYYEWPYGTDVEQYVPGEPEFKMTIVGRQKDPSGGA